MPIYCLRLELMIEAKDLDILTTDLAILSTKTEIDIADFLKRYRKIVVNADEAGNKVLDSQISILKGKLDAEHEKDLVSDMQREARDILDGKNKEDMSAV